MNKAFNEDYSVHWQGMTVKGQRVLDLGCDHGSTASYFLSRGAKSVLGVDCDSSLVKFALDAGLPNFVAVCMKIDRPEQVETLVNVAAPDVVKVDIEGAEQVLLATRREILLRPREWIIETHTLELHVKIMELFRALGFNVSSFNYYASHLNVVHATQGVSR